MIHIITYLILMKSSTCLRKSVTKLQNMLTLLTIFIKKKLRVWAGAFSFTYLLYLSDYFSLVGASVFAGVFLVARDITEKTLTPVNKNQNQNRKLNHPESLGQFFFSNPEILMIVSGNTNIIFSASSADP